MPNNVLARCTLTHVDENIPNIFSASLISFTFKLPSSSHLCQQNNGDAIVKIWNSTSKTKSCVVFFVFFAKVHAGSGSSVVENSVEFGSRFPVGFFGLGIANGLEGRVKKKI